LTGSSVVRQIMHQTESHRPRIAFFAGLQLNIDSMPPEQRVVMNNTITNVGNAYDPERGEFCATVDGVYALIVAISAQGQKQAAVRLMHNDKHIFDVWCESSPWSTATNQALLLMRRGDCAWLQVRESAIYLHGYMYSTFAGYMLFEHPLV
uniref:C1q domain-containing protein n=1 Tax=Schistocephalus solidus TaxID=70667 RepID=A0A183T228_SCHSO